ncbi:MAG: hypothetical protein K5785_00995 [Nitrosarchaeum sp.]|nr:hypothetical protein [Nitrosarchaeum sp.]
MVTAIVPHSHVDLEKEVQTIIEDDVLTNPTNIGVIPTNPTFLAVGPDGGSIVSTFSPTKRDRRKAGTRTRIGISVTKKKYTARLVFKASDNNLALQKWCINESAKGGTVTPAATRTFLKSYLVGATETYEIFRGCVPEKTNIGVSKDGEIIYTVDLKCKTIVENQTANGGITLGTGAFASPDTAAPWKASDGGANAFAHNSINYGLEGMSIDITREYAVQDPSESLEDMMYAETINTVSGSVDIQKSNIAISTDARATTLRAMTLVLKAATLTLTFANANFDGHTGLDHDPTSSALLTDSENFTADSVVAA